MAIFRRRAQTPLRYFLYISDTKLDMLYDQIDKGTLRRITAEVSIDLKLASVRLTQAPQAPVATRIAKLRVVEAFIDKHHSVGNSQSPGKEYFRGQMDMHWGWLGGGIDSGPVVIFRGRDEGGFVMLAGSRRHVIGEQQEVSGRNAEAGSAMPSIMAGIGEHISQTPEYAEFIRDTRARGNKAVDSEETASVFDPPESYVDAAANIILSAPYQSVEFLARPLVEGTVRVPDQWRLGLAPSTSVPEAETETQTAHGVLGTPLYVALAADGIGAE
jgi:hypothetical protein